MNKKKPTRVIISGLGISGLITAALLCKEKIKVECFEPSDISKFCEEKNIGKKKEKLIFVSSNPSFQVGLFTSMS